MLAFHAMVEFEITEEVYDMFIGLDCVIPPNGRISLDAVVKAGTDITRNAAPCILMGDVCLRAIGANQRVAGGKPALHGLIPRPQPCLVHSRVSGQR